MLFEAFVRAAGTLPETIGIRLNGKTHSYHQLAERSEHLASGLRGLGIEIGDVVAILMRNSPDFFVLVQALFAVGAVAVPLDVQANPSELARALDQLNVRVVIASADFGVIAEQLAFGAGVELPVILAEGGTGPSLASLEKTAIGKLPAVGPEVAALYLFSSGSTGRPKVVPRTHGEMLADFNTSGGAMGFAPGDVMINILPAHHAFGLLMGAIYAPFTGATTLLWQPNKPLMLARDNLLQTLADIRLRLIPLQAEILIVGDFHSLEPLVVRVQQRAVHA